MDEELRRLQLCEVEILKEISKICSRHNLHWFAIGGTMLGAVRHKGFIPWDDDIDIGLPRKDYDRFWEYAEKELPEYLKPLLAVKDYKLLYGKVHDTGTTCIENCCRGKKEWYKGVFVDVMPFDGVPDFSFARKLYYKAVYCLVVIYNNRRFGKIRKTGIKGIQNALPASLVYRLWHFIITRHDIYHSQNTCYTWAPDCKKNTFAAKDFLDVIYVPFEDMQIPIPRNYDKCLTVQYGDYMQLPPPEKRFSHSKDGIIDLTKPYTDYLR